MKKYFNKKTLATFIFSYLIWCLYVADFSTQELIVGFIISLFVSITTYPFSLKKGFFKIFYPKNILNFFIYVPVFLWEMIKANVDLAYRTLHPKLPINPGIVKIPTNIKSELGLATLANSITLTPGTITVDIVKENDTNMLYVHWINVKTRDIEKERKLIDERLERIIRRTFP